MAQRPRRFHVRRRLILLCALVSALLLPPASVVSAASVVHRVTAGGPDACVSFGGKPGCDGNYSFVAFQYADGSGSGQYTDRFARGEGIHGIIDCVRVVGKAAWVSGWITSGTGFNGFDLTGLPFTTLVVDNGTSAQQPPDQIASSHVGDDTPCTAMEPWDTLGVAPQGQVTVN